MKAGYADMVVSPETREKTVRVPGAALQITGVIGGIDGW